MPWSCQTSGPWRSVERELLLQQAAPQPNFSPGPDSQPYLALAQALTLALALNHACDPDLR